MAMQTASDITIIHGDDAESVLSLDRVEGSLISYKLSDFRGTPISGVAQPQLDFTLRRPSKGQNSVKYMAELKVPLWDESVSPWVYKGQALVSCTVIVPNHDEGRNILLAGMQDVVALFLENSGIKQAMANAQFLR